MRRRLALARRAPTPVPADRFRTALRALDDLMAVLDAEGNYVEILTSHVVEAGRFLDQVALAHGRRARLAFARAQRGRSVA